ISRRPACQGNCDYRLSSRRAPQRLLPVTVSTPGRRPIRSAFRLLEDPLLSAVDRGSFDRVLQFRRSGSKSSVGVIALPDGGAGPKSSAAMIGWPAGRAWRVGVAVVAVIAS